MESLGTLWKDPYDASVLGSFHKVLRLYSLS